LAGASTLKPEVVSGLDILIVRELTGDIYFGQPRGVRECPDGPFKGEREGFDTMRYAESEIRRIAHVAFQAAHKRDRRLDSAGKRGANPRATISAAAMMLRYSLNRAEQANRIEAAVKRVLAQGLRTADIYEAGTTKVGTREMGDAVVKALQ